MKKHETKNRALLILEYLWKSSDEGHPVTTSDILSHLSEYGIISTRKTIACDIVELQELGIDIICNRRKQNEYFIGSRLLEPVEVKILMDAVQAAKFLSPQKSVELINKLAVLSSEHQKETLKRSLRTERAKTSNNKVYYIVDNLFAAILKKQALSFQYLDYTAEGKRALKHDGQVYTLSPYDLVWNEDGYYIFGWSETHGKVVKFRVDRICNQEESNATFHDPPDDYDIASFCRSVFSMYDGKLYKVELKCENSTLPAVLDRFGENICVQDVDQTHFKVLVDVYISSTFYAWVVSFGGKVEIHSPDKVVSYFSEFLDLFKQVS